MKRQAIAIVVLMTSGIASAQADETLSVDKSTQFANSILGTWQPAPGSVSNDKPDVDKSLGLFASSVLGGAKSLPDAVSNDRPDVDKSLGLFASSILN